MSNRRNSWKPSAIALAVGLCMSSVVLAQSAEGSLYGRAKGGSSVTITAVDSGASRQIKANPDGTFTFPKLAPGRYRVSADGNTREVTVAIGSGTEVSFDAPQSVVVVGSRLRSSIDVASVESSSIFTQDQIRALPVARSVDAVALLAPGVVKGDNFGTGLTLPSIGGASIAENGYYINGMDVTNIRNFLSYAEIPFDAIAEQQVKIGGYGAEYGRSLGGVVSLVTKRGTNTWKGGASFYWEPKSLQSRGPDVADKEPERAGLPFVFNSADFSDNKSYVVYGGGPVVKDRLFVFAALDLKDESRHIFNQSNSNKRTNRSPNGMLKIDWSITDSHLLEFTGINAKKKYQFLDYNNPATSSYATTHLGDGAVSEATEGGSVSMLKYTGYLTSDLTVSALAGKMNDKRLKYTGARTLGQDCPVVLETNVSEIGCWVGPFPGVGAKDPAAPDDEDKRSSFRFDVDYALGSHTIRAGYDGQTFKSSEAGGSSYTGGFYYRYFLVPANGRVNGVDGFTPGTQYVRRRILQSTSGEYEVGNTAYYIEDSWKATRNVLLYGGLRWESFVNKNSDGVEFVKRDRLLAPRVGFSWDMNGDSSLKIFGNAGRYFIPVASNTNIRATRAELFVQQFFTFSGRDPRTQGPLNLGANQIGNPQVVSDGQLPDPGTVADTQLRPMNQDEFIVGVQKALSKSLVVGAKVTSRKINAGMDDYCDHTRVAAWIKANVRSTYVDNLATCMLMNPGEDLNIKVDLAGDGNLIPVTIPASALGLARYERTYKGLEFTVERPWDGKWSLQGSYTWSKSQGTAEGYVQSNLNQDDAGVTQDFDFGSFTDGSKGYLPNDRRHVLKLFGNYAVTDEFRLGFSTTVASGRPLSCIGFVPPTVSDFAGAGQYTSASAYYCIKEGSQRAVLVERGSVGRTPWTYKADLSFSYQPAALQKKLTLQIDVFNVFNSQKATELSETRDYSRADSNGANPPYRQNANYLSPTTFQDPRYVRLTARYEF